MSKEVSLFEGSQLPSHLADMFGDEGNIEVGQRVNTLSIKGKVFRIVYEGDEVPLMRHNDDTGESEPMSVLNLIVLNQGPFGARDFYMKAYDSAETAGPDCFSVDGKVPHGLSPHPQSKTCATCPHAVKGSKTTPSGHPTTSCSLKRRLAVVPAHKPAFAALLFKLASSSAYDPDTKNAENGWMGWRQYLDFLNARGVRHTAQLVTKVKFDSDSEYPKVLFKPERFLTEDEAAIIGPRIRSEEVEELICPTDTAGPIEPETPTIRPDEFTEEEEDEEEAPKPTKVTKKKKVSKKKAAKQVVDEDEDEEEEEDEDIKRTPAAGQPSKKAPTGNKNINALLDDWDV